MTSALKMKQARDTDDAHNWSSNDHAMMTSSDSHVILSPSGPQTREGEKEMQQRPCDIDDSAESEWEIVVV